MAQHLDHPAGTSLPQDLLRTGFHVGANRSDDVSLLRLRGELDMATAVDLRRALAAAISLAPLVLIVDVSELTFIDSTGIGVLVGSSRKARDAGCSFVVRSPSRSVLKTLHLTGVDQVLDIEADPRLN